MRVPGVVVSSLLAALTSACLSACGSSSGASSVVASVAGSPITKASLDHWLRIEAVATWKTIPTEPAPTGVLPDPPSYSTCIAWLASPRGLVASRSLSVAQRKAACAQRLDTLREKTLQFLIIYQWFTHEVKDQGIGVPESEVEHNVRLLVKQEGLTNGKYQSYLSSTGMSEADLIYTQRLATSGDKLNKEVQAKSNPTEIRRALATLTAKWVAETSCEPGYVVPGCRQYHGSEPPP